MPEFQEPKCFVSNGDPKEFITECIQYLVSISTKSSSLLREQYAPVFEALKIARGPTNNVTHEDQLTQTLVESQEAEEQDSEEEDESRGIDLITSDDEDDEEEIEPENEEDRISR